MCKSFLSISYVSTGIFSVLLMIYENLLEEFSHGCLLPMYRQRDKKNLKQ